MIPYAAAVELILSNLPSVRAERIPHGAALWRVLSADVVAEEDVPPFANSGMDGYALRAESTSGASEVSPVCLHVIGEVLAGRMFEGNVSGSDAVRIYTGAPVPDGADAVVEQELVKAADGAILVPLRLNEGRNIRPAGEDIRRGEVVLRKGMRITAARWGVLASLGIREVLVTRRMRVAFLTTGDELVSPEESPAGGKIRNSNAYTLQALLESEGVEAVSLGAVGDDEWLLEEKIRQGIAFDLLVTSGGVSVGKHDLVLGVLERLGVRIIFWKVNIKPGKPLVFGVYEERETGRRVPVFGLPGNPVSTMVTFLQFVRPAIRRMMGLIDEMPTRLTATTEHEISKSDNKRHFLRGMVRSDGNVWYVSTTGSQSSGVLTSMAKANCLIILSEEQRTVPAGHPVDIELL